VRHGVVYTLRVHCIAHVPTALHTCTPHCTRVNCTSHVFDAAARVPFARVHSVTHVYTALPTCPLYMYRLVLT
jgi:hypothetical protein